MIGHFQNKMTYQSLEPEISFISYMQGQIMTFSEP